MKFLTTLFVTIAISASAVAQPSIFADDSDQFPRVRDLNWLNQNFLNKQRERADEITREQLAIKVKTHHLKQNIKLFQRLINEDKLTSYDEMYVQSLGVILGDIYVAEVDVLEWKVYEDDLGKTHAVCVRNTKHCIFPITMISRRTKVGLKPDVQRIYQKGYDAVSEYFPKKPFSD